MSYQIGQYRFEGEQWCLSDVIGTSLVTKPSSTSSVAFQDMAIKLADGSDFDPSKSYYLNVKIPQDLSYDIGFTLKLMGAGSSDDDLLRFQTIDSIFVPKGGSGSNSYHVVLYKSLDSTEDNEIVKVAIPEVKPNTNGASVKDKVYYTVEEVTGKYIYWIGTGNGYINMNELGDPAPYNDMFISATWRNSFSKEDYLYIFFDLVFTPIQDGFHQLVFEMTRTGDDFNILHSDGTYGRVVPLEMVEYKLCEVKDLLVRIGHRPLSKISVQSHSGLLMSVNGEQIKVGPSKLYELDAVPIKTLGIVAHGYEDNFIIDYKYEE